MDPILFWNAVALEANRVSHTTGMDTGTLGPTQSSRAGAIVHLAMYDAYAGAKGNPAHLPPYLPGLPAPPAGIVPDAAVAGAAHATLTKLYASQTAYFDARLVEAQSFLPVGPGIAMGIKFGQEVAAALSLDRQNDPTATDMGYVAQDGRGDHRPDPDNYQQGYHGPFYGAKSKCFAVSKRHALKEPPKPGSADYNEALVQVRGKGICTEQMGTLPAKYPRRTDDETIVGIYWGYDGAAELGTPPRLYNQIVRSIAQARNNSTDDNARLFALVNVAMGDAGILSWEQKYIHNLWRPVMGIREHDQSMGASGTASNNTSNDCDINWLPLGAPKSNAIASNITSPYPVYKNFTPPFPAYPSGHATFGAAALQIVRLFYGVSGVGPDNLLNGISFVSDEMNGSTRDNKGTLRPRHKRSFPQGLWQMIEENGFSRVFLGVHWSFDSFALHADNTPDLSQNIGGVPLGLKIAEDIFNGSKNTGLKKSTVGPSA